MAVDVRAIRARYQAIDPTVITIKTISPVLSEAARFEALARIVEILRRSADDVPPLLAEVVELRARIAELEAAR